MWGALGLLAGPFVGTAAAWLHKGGLRAALGGGLLAGIGVGLALYGSTRGAYTTDSSYWIAVGVLAVALVGYLLIRAVRGWLAVVLLAVTVLVALLLTAASRML